ncbi:MAG TPA: hypothetical protein PKN70_06855 [Smithellaceae bacterium]|nr:hypothetical protein [Smithellaceae bacterium]HQM45931.1 hypothetical protein [Smithellaceae bacterium]
MNQAYRIKKAFRVPFAVVAVLLLILLLSSFYGGPTWERILFAVLWIGATLVAIEINEREFLVSKDGLRIQKFFRVKQLTWAEITHLGVVVLRNKAYFLLTTTKGFYIFSNLLQDHTLLVRYLADKLETEKVEAEVNQYLENPIERKSLVVLTWIALLVITALILTKFLKP